MQRINVYSLHPNERFFKKGFPTWTPLSTASPPARLWFVSQPSSVRTRNEPKLFPTSTRRSLPSWKLCSMSARASAFEEGGSPDQAPEAAAAAKTRRVLPLWASYIMHTWC